MRRSLAAAWPAAVALALVLTGCGAAGSADPGQPAAGDPAASAAAGAPADAELDRFRGALAGHGPAAPDALVGALEAAGFPRASMERTREVDSLGAPVTFMEIAVATSSDCLVGQVGDGEPVALRAPALAGGRCLVGDVVALD